MASKKDRLSKIVDKSSILKTKTNQFSQETKKAILTAEESPSKENINKAIEVINEDSALSENERAQLAGKVKELFLKRFNFDNCPEDYNELKKEAKYLAGMTQLSFMLMAQRLLKIRDEKLYTEDGYDDFQGFVSAELPITRRTAYDYINIIECFGVRTFAHEQDFKYTKLLPAIPLLKSESEDVPKDEIKKRFIAEVKSGKSVREIKKVAEEFKKNYGLKKPDGKVDEYARAIKKLKSLFEVVLSDEQKVDLKALLIRLDNVHNLNLLK